MLSTQSHPQRYHPLCRLTEVVWWLVPDILMAACKQWQLSQAINRDFNALPCTQNACTHQVWEWYYTVASTKCSVREITHRLKLFYIQLMPKILFTFSLCTQTQHLTPTFVLLGMTVLRQQGVPSTHTVHIPLINCLTTTECYIVSVHTVSVQVATQQK